MCIPTSTQIQERKRPIPWEVQWKVWTLDMCFCLLFLPRKKPKAGNFFPSALPWDSEKDYGKWEPHFLLLLLLCWVWCNWFHSQLGAGNFKWFVDFSQRVIIFVFLNQCFSEKESLGFPVPPSCLNNQSLILLFVLFFSLCFSFLIKYLFSSKYFFISFWVSSDINIIIIILLWFYWSLSLCFFLFFPLFFLFVQTGSVEDCDLSSVLLILFSFISTVVLRPASNLNSFWQFFQFHIFHLVLLKTSPFSMVKFPIFSRKF